MEPRTSEIPALTNDFLNPTAFHDDPVPPTASATLVSQAGTESPAPSDGPPGMETLNVPGYSIVKELGRGGMGVVYLARHLELQRLVALKMLLGKGYSSADDFSRFRTEAQALAQVQHPQIVQIYEVGQNQGLPYFALEYVPGGSLDRQIKGQPQKPDEAAALVALLAEAMQAAHDRGIIHRDLKPANVLLLSHASEARDLESPTLTFNPRLNEVTPKITDFGLAKRLDLEGQTRTGDLLGTPSYMAPEQASGGRMGTVGPATDIYALGAILYELLTGRPPFQGVSAVETVMQVMLADVVPPRRLQPGVPLDLETICLKCLQKEPSRRYASAAALAEDLRRFSQGKPILARPVGMVEKAWRWCRRNPVVAGLTAAVFVLLVGTVVGLSLGLAHVTQLNTQLDDANMDLRAANAREQTARQRAEAGYALARDAADKYLSQTTDHPKLKEEAFHDLRLTLLKAALPFFQKIADEQPTDPRQKAVRADALARLAFVRQELGESEQACEDYEAARVIYAELALAFPQEPRYRDNEANCLDHRASVLVTLGRSREADEGYQRSLALRQERLRSQPGEVQLRRSLAVSHNNFALHLHQTQRYAEAQQQYLAARTTQEDLLKEHPRDKTLRRYQGKTLSGLGQVWQALGKFPEAEKAMRENIALQQALHAEDPKEPVTRQDLGNAYNHLGNLFRLLRRRDEAEKECRRALEVQTALARDFPTVPRYSQEVAGTWHNLSVLLMDMERFADAEKAAREAGTILAPLGEQYPDQPSYRADMGRHLQALGSLQYKQKRWPEAEKTLREAIATLKAVVISQPARYEYKQTLAYAYSLLASTLEKLNRDEEAITQSREGLVLRRQLAEALPHLPQYAIDVGTGHNNLAYILGRNSRHEDAVVEYSQGIATLEPVVRKYPRHPPARAALRTSYAGRAYFQEEAANYTAALPDYDRAIALDTPPTRDELRARRAMLWARQGDMAKAKPEIDALAALPSLRDTAVYAVACASGWMITQIKDDPTVQEDHAALTMKLLQRLKEMGYFKNASHVKQLHKEEAFAPLRQREDYRRFVSQLSP